MKLKKIFLTIIFLLSFASIPHISNVTFADHCTSPYYHLSIVNVCVRDEPDSGCTINETSWSATGKKYCVPSGSPADSDQGQEPGDQTPSEGVIPSPKLPGPDDAPELAGLTGKGFSEENLVGKLVSDIIPIILGLAGFLTVIFIVISGIQFITSSGNPEAAAAARARLTFALVGFIIIILAFAITQLVDTIFLGGSGIL